MITFLAIVLLGCIVKDNWNTMGETDFIIMAILAHSIANEVAILIKGRWTK